VIKKKHTYNLKTDNFDNDYQEFAWVENSIDSKWKQQRHLWKTEVRNSRVFSFEVVKENTLKIQTSNCPARLMLFES
jgi:hypothetical protein